MADTLALTLAVNGVDCTLQVDTRVTLLDALCDHLDPTGTKKACNRGECGACTVLIDGRRVNSCLTFALMQQAREITTVEGLASGDQLHPVQAAFIEHDAFQCGYCTPGQIISAVALLKEGHTGSAEEIREWMSGNICRCGAYPNIVRQPLRLPCDAARFGEGAWAASRLDPGDLCVRRRRARRQGSR